MGCTRRQVDCKIEKNATFKKPWSKSRITRNVGQFTLKLERSPVTLSFFLPVLKFLRTRELCAVPEATLGVTDLETGHVLCECIISRCLWKTKGGVEEEVQMRKGKKEMREIIWTVSCRIWSSSWNKEGCYGLETPYAGPPSAFMKRMGVHHFVSYFNLFLARLFIFLVELNIKMSYTKNKLFYCLCLYVVPNFTSYYDHVSNNKSKIHFGPRIQFGIIMSYLLLSCSFILSLKLFHF